MLTSIYFDVTIGDHFWEPEEPDCNHEDECDCQENFQKWEAQIFEQCWKQLKKVYQRVIIDNCKYWFVNNELTLTIMDIDDRRRHIKVKCTGQHVLDNMKPTLTDWQDTIDFMFNEKCTYEQNEGTLYDKDGIIVIHLEPSFE